MRWSNVAAALMAGSVLASCGFVPALEQATGEVDHEQSKILIRDVVQRIKCELAESFHEKRNQADYLWLREWTIKADLTLQINDQAGIAPSGSYTHFQRNAFNRAAGSTSLTSTTIASVSQFFTVAAGVNLGGQALRSEVLSFSLALDELEAWYNEVNRRESAPDFPDAQRICVPRHMFGLAAGLGLDEWIDSAVAPVSGKDLLAGFHPSPITARAPTAPNPVAPPKSLAGAPLAVVPLTEADQERIKKEVRDGAVVVAQSDLAIAKAAGAVAQVKLDLDQGVRVIQSRQRAYKTIATDAVLGSLRQAVRQLSDLQTLAADDATLADSDTKESKGIRSAVSLVLKDVEGSTPNFLEDEQSIKAALARIDTLAKHVKEVSDHAQEVRRIAAMINVSPDPPIDSILHSVQFVVSYGGSITPSWTLIQWKGPGLSGPAASAQGARTHILQLALGPRGAGGAKTSDEQARLIQNSTILLSRQ